MGVTIGSLRCGNRNPLSVREVGVKRLIVRFVSQGSEVFPHDAKETLLPASTEIISSKGRPIGVDHFRIHQRLEIGQRFGVLLASDVESKVVRVRKVPYARQPPGASDKVKAIPQTLLVDEPTNAIGVVLSVAIRVLLGKSDRDFPQFFCICGDFESEFIEPVLADDQALAFRKRRRFGEPVLLTIECHQIDQERIIVVCFHSLGHERHQISNRSHQTQVHQPQQSTPAVIIGTDYLEQVGEIIRRRGSIDLGFPIRTGWDDHIGEVNVQVLPDDVIGNPVVWRRASFGHRCLRPEFDIHGLRRCCGRHSGRFRRRLRWFSDFRYGGFGGCCGGSATCRQNLAQYQNKHNKHHFPVFHLLSFLGLLKREY